MTDGDSVVGSRWVSHREHRTMRAGALYLKEGLMPSSQVMHKFKMGQLHSGSKTGPTVKNRKQAIAIMLSERRNEDEHGGTYQEPRTKPKRSKRG